MLLYQNKSA